MHPSPHRRQTIPLSPSPDAMEKSSNGTTAFAARVRRWLPRVERHLSIQKLTFLPRLMEKCNG